MDVFPNSWHKGPYYSMRYHHYLLILIRISTPQFSCFLQSPSSPSTSSSRADPWLGRQRASSCGVSLASCFVNKSRENSSRRSGPWRRTQTLLDQLVPDGAARLGSNPVPGRGWPGWSLRVLILCIPPWTAGGSGVRHDRELQNGLVCFCYWTLKAYELSDQSASICSRRWCL